MEDEIFGPLLPVIEYDNLTEAIAMVNARPNPLALYFFSRDKKKQKRVLREVSSGGSCVNDTMIHETRAPALRRRRRERDPEIPRQGKLRNGFACAKHRKKRFFVRCPPALSSVQGPSEMVEEIFLSGRIVCLFLSFGHGTGSPFPLIKLRRRKPCPFPA